MFESVEPGRTRPSAGSRHSFLEVTRMVRNIVSRWRHGSTHSAACIFGLSSAGFPSSRRHLFLPVRFICPEKLFTFAEKALRTRGLKGPRVFLCRLLLLLLFFFFVSRSYEFRLQPTMQKVFRLRNGTLSGEKEKRRKTNRG